MNFIRAYLKFTKHYYYGFIMVLPMLVLYEIGLFWVYKNLTFKVRNLIEYFFKLFLEKIGCSAFFIISIILMLSVVLLCRPRKDFLVFRLKYFFMVLTESFLYAVLFAFFTIKLYAIPFFIGENFDDISLKFALSLGAGVYEEILFRMILFGGLIFLLSRLFRIHRFVLFFIGLVISSVLFSYAHFFGSKESFSLYAFVFRFFGGVFFCVIYRLRGFAIVAYTHAIYDILVVFSIIQ